MVFPHYKNFIHIMVRRTMNAAHSKRQELTKNVSAQEGPGKPREPAPLSDHNRD
jgi:hypothetical protein